jgi:hypothetical protein
MFTNGQIRDAPWTLNSIQVEVRTQRVAELFPSRDQKEGSANTKFPLIPSEEQMCHETEEYKVNK